MLKSLSEKLIVFCVEIRLIVNDWGDTNQVKYTDKP